MNELKGIRAMLSNEWKGKIRFINLEDETQYVDVPLEKGVGSISNADKWGDFFLEQLTGKRQPVPAELFEQALNITSGQLIELYKYWGSTKVILVKDTAIRLAISNKEASIIKDLAFRYNLITRGHNSAWKIVDPIIQGRWIEQASKLERGEKPLNYNMPKTPQESLDRLERKSTPEQKAKARGEVYIEKDIVEEEVEESPIEVVREGLYSPAKEAKEREKKIRDEQIKRDSEQYKQEANSKDAQPIVPKCIRVIGVIEEKEKEKLKKQRK